MSTIGSPIETSLLQAAQAQQSASKARDKEKAATDSARRFADQVDLRVAGLETAEAVKALPQNDSEQEKAERHAKDQDGASSSEHDDDRPHVDVRV